MEVHNFYRLHASPRPCTALRLQSSGNKHPSRTHNTCRTRRHGVHCSSSSLCRGSILTVPTVSPGPYVHTLEYSTCRQMPYWSCVGRSGFLSPLSLYPPHKCDCKWIKRYTRINIRHIYLIRRPELGSSSDEPECCKYSFQVDGSTAARTRRNGCSSVYCIFSVPVPTATRGAELLYCTARCVMRYAGTCTPGVSTRRSHLQGSGARAYQVSGRADDTH
jgi:hypothetical protein